MRAIRVHVQGGPEVLQFEEVPDPTPGPTDAIVRVHATALNHLDVWLRQGQPGRVVQLPLTPGADIAGEVTAVGVAGERSWLGKRVAVYPGLGTANRAPRFAGDESFSVGFGVISGGYAELVRVPAASLVELPPGVDWIAGAAYPVTFTTAWHMLAVRARVTPGMTVLVHGAGAGVGNAALQVARLHGARVIATAGAEDKLLRAREMGADVTINYRTQDFVAATLEATEGLGADIAIDHIGGETLANTVRALAVGGMLVNCGVTAGSTVTLDFRQIYPRQISILGSMLGSRADMVEVTRFIGNGRLRPVISAVLPWTDVQAAHRLMESRDIFGKIVLRVRDV